MYIDRVCCFPVRAAPAFIRVARISFGDLDCPSMPRSVSRATGRDGTTRFIAAIAE